MILHINNVLSHQTKTHSSPYLWWRSMWGELWLILLLTRNELFSHRCSLILFSLAKSRHAVPRLDLTFLLGASDLVCAWTCEISWLLIRDSPIYKHLTLCTGQGSISLISLTQTDTRQATFFVGIFPSSEQDKALLSLHPYPPVIQQLIYTTDFYIFKILNYFQRNAIPNNRSD